MSFQFTIGADPEIFLTENGKGISALGIIEGDKKNPKPCKSGAYQVDGMAAEFNLTPVAINDFNAFNANIVTVMKELETAVKSKNPNARFAIQPTMDFDKDYLDAQPDEAKELGCDPDFNAYTMKENPTPDAERTFRTGAGHIHIGWGSDIPVENTEHMEICAGFVKMLDATVGLAMTYIDRDPRRRELYGCAGAFRPKSYGVEYRTPSNEWLKTRNRRQLIHVLTNQAVHYMQSGYKITDITGTVDVEKVINSGDFTTAERCINRLIPYATAWNSEKTVMNAKKV